jgi:mycothiol synthase
MLFVLAGPRSPGRYRRWAARDTFTGMSSDRDTTARAAHPYIQSPHEHQLEMVLPPGDGPRVPPAPDGYTLRTFDEGDDGAYNELFHLAWPDDGTLAHTRRFALEGGFLVVEHTATRLLVASCAAFGPQPGRHPHDGSLGWLVVDPTHTRRGLATLVAATVTQQLRQAAYALPWLGTEDDRLPAIALYLDLGWQPHLYVAGMEERWRLIFGKLGRPFSLSDCIEA